jgi:DNA-binding LacI/PurR family transcriptional regulator
MAFGALHALRRSGLRCPEDVSIVGIDDHELADTFDMTTVAQPVDAQGAAAARWLIARLDGAYDPQAPDDDVCLHAVRLVLRGSTGPPPSPS